MLGCAEKLHLTANKVNKANHQPNLARNSNRTTHLTITTNKIPNLRDRSLQPTKTLPLKIGLLADHKAHITETAARRDGEGS